MYKVVMLQGGRVADRVFTSEAIERMRRMENVEFLQNPNSDPPSTDAAKELMSVKSVATDAIWSRDIRCTALHTAGAVNNGLLALGDFIVTELERLLSGERMSGEIEPSKLRLLS